MNIVCVYVTHTIFESLAIECAYISNNISIRLGLELQVLLFLLAFDN